MQRREYLALGGTGLAAIVAGCNGDSDDSTPTDPATETPTETATATETPTDTPVPDIEAMNFSDSGDSVVRGIEIEGGFTVFDLNHSGDSNFIVQLQDDQTGESVAFLANAIGDWTGTYPLYVPPGRYLLDIDAGGGWNITVSQPRWRSSDVRDPPESGSDAFPNYFGPLAFENVTTITGEYEGEQNFIVELLDESGSLRDLLFNDIGRFEGEATIPSIGTGHIRVDATGPWEVSIEE